MWDGFHPVRDGFHPVRDIYPFPGNIPYHSADEIGCESALHDLRRKNVPLPEGGFRPEILFFDGDTVRPGGISFSRKYRLSSVNSVPILTFLASTK
jgi:hypothetical protein